MPPKARNKHKSPAEFFAENQNIAGFDNPGKSLFTTVREFVENSLDAAESAARLPRIEVSIEQLDQHEFHELRGLQTQARCDKSLYSDNNQQKKHKNTKTQETKISMNDNESSQLKPADGLHSAGTEFFTVTCKDNGIGMPHDSIPSMLAIVLSSTKYGVKQSRGKFGLGAKMALVWSKKSTGMPVEVYTSQNGDKISYCKLDIDIYKNEPIVLQHQYLHNPDHWIGTEMNVTIEGKWASYKSKILSYLRQLAIITPYAEFEFRYSKKNDSKKNLTVEFTRRTDKMPPAAIEVKHHPSAVDNLLVESVINTTTKKHLSKFLAHEFSNISPVLSKRLIAELGGDFQDDTLVKKLSKKQIHQLTRLLRVAKFSPPSGDCLSPAGEYNLRLGIFKELQPELVSTFISKPCVFEGHPFIVETGVAIGGKTSKPGVTVYRFANRIPLLFEAGSDVSTKVSNLKVKWAYYKIRPKIDKIAVFVSIVSTKIPFKSSSKEYIGDDKDGGVIHDTIKDCINQCCRQLKMKITKQSTIKDRESRKKNVTRYIPDVSRAIHSLLATIEDKDFQQQPSKRVKLHNGMFITLDSLKAELEKHVMKKDQSAALEGDAASHTKRVADQLFLGTDEGRDFLPRIVHPQALFSFRLLR